LNGSRTPLAAHTAQHMTRLFPSWRTLAAVVLAGWTAVAVVLFSSTYAALTFSGARFELARVLAGNALQAYSWAPVTPLILLLAWRFPIRWGAPRHAALHLAAALPVVTARLALFHYGGQGLGVLRTEVEFAYALFTYMADSLFTYAAVAGVAHAVAYTRVVREREVAREQLQTQLARAQLQALKAQLHPHFLFNTLQAISTLVHLDPARAELVIGSLSDLLRGALAHHDAQEVTLREELAALHPYLEIERTRLGARLAVELAIDPEVLEARVPHLLLQPLAENAVRHGIAPLRAGGRLRITATRRNQTLRLAISDNGAGITGAPREGAVGLANTRARLERLYGTTHTFLIHSAPSRGTRVELELPFTCRAAT
jgi:hypothetical protein